MVRQRVFESGLFLILGFAAILDAVRLAGLKSATGIPATHAAGYQLLLGCLLVPLAIAYLLRQGREPGQDWRLDSGLKRLLLGFAILMLYALAMDALGYTLSTALALIALLRAFSPYRLAPVAVLSCLTAVGSAWLWAALVIALPRGFIPWP